MATRQMSKVEVVKQVKWHLHEKTSCDTPSIDKLGLTVHLAMTVIADYSL
jgi:hypothetical protein